MPASQPMRCMAMNARRSASAIRTAHPTRCTGRLWSSINRRTDRADTLRISAACSMVKNLSLLGPALSTDDGPSKLRSQRFELLWDFIGDLLGQEGRGRSEAGRLAE